MTFDPTAFLGTSKSSLANIVPGYFPGVSVGQFGFFVHVLDSRTIRVVYSQPVTDSALNPAAYTLFQVTIGQVTTPSVLSCEFYDADQYSVALTFPTPLTPNVTYALQLAGTIQSFTGLRVSTPTYNFVHTVPEMARPLGAFLSATGYVDLVFDRDVSNSTSATAYILATGGSNINLTYVPGGTPPQTLRFSYPGSFTAGNNWVLHYAAVKDSSYNISVGSTPLTFGFVPSGTTGPSDFKSIRLNGAFFSKITHDATLTSIDAYFNTPMTKSSVEDPNSWTVTKHGSHPHADTHLVTAPNAVDDASLLTLSFNIQARFNDHIKATNVHMVDINSGPTVIAFISLVNELFIRTNQHFADSGAHHPSDKVDISSSSIARDVNSALALLNGIKARFNAHLSAIVSAVPIHRTSDTDFPIVTANANGIISGSRLADELRAKFIMHVAGPYHYATPVDVTPSVPYCLLVSAYPLPSTAQDAIGLINEVYAKLTNHEFSTAYHVYADDINSFASVLVAPHQAAASYVLANSIKTGLNGHQADTYTIPIQNIASDCSNAESFPVQDAWTYRTRLNLSSLSYQVPISVTCTALAEDGITHMTGPNNIAVAASPTSSMVLSSTYAYKTAFIRISCDVSTPPVDQINITSSNNIIQVLNVRKIASISSLALFVGDLMRDFTQHLSENIHVTIDTADVLPLNTYPTHSLISIVAALNVMINYYNLHVSGIQFHRIVTGDDIVEFPDAYDLESATTLAELLARKFKSHVANSIVHKAPGLRQLTDVMKDMLAISIDGALDGSVCNFSINTHTSVSDGTNFLLQTPVSLSGQFMVTQDPPYIASSLPRIALQIQDYQFSYGADALDIYFSKPLLTQPLQPSDIHLAGPSGFTLSEPSWVDPRVLSVPMVGMVSNSTYTLDVIHIQDIWNNPIASYP